MRDIKYCKNKWYKNRFDGNLALGLISYTSGYIIYNLWQSMSIFSNKNLLQIIQYPKSFLKNLLLKTTNINKKLLVSNNIYEKSVNKLHDI